MDMKTKTEIGVIRNFNRFYTNILGLIDQHILKSEFSLSEVRVLHEIEKTENCTSKMLSETLMMDEGYLSRIIKKFEKRGFLRREQSKEDKRAYNLYITDTGRKRMNELNNASSSQIADLIRPLTERERTLLASKMTWIETILSDGKTIRLDDISIRSDIHPGDMGYITYMHGWIYHEEYGYSPAFESYVAESFYQFAKNYRAEKEHLWCAEHNGNIVGCIGIAEHGSRAQLRWFLLDPHYRGIGLGKMLLNEALAFAKNAGYESIYLDTTSDLDTAISMYQKAGFVKTKEKPNDSWRKGLMELEFEMQL